MTAIHTPGRRISHSKEYCFLLVERIQFVISWSVLRASPMQIRSKLGIQSVIGGTKLPIGVVALILVVLAGGIGSCQQEPSPVTGASREPQPTSTSSADGSGVQTPSVTEPPPLIVPTDTADGEEFASDESESISETAASPGTPASPGTASSTDEPPQPASTIVSTDEVSPTEENIERPEGALVAVEMDGRVGVLLDEIPEDMRDGVAQSLISRPEADWLDLARRQVKLTERRLNFRNFNYPGKGQLPLPPEELWLIELVGDDPVRRTVQGHDLVTVDFSFASTLLSDSVSVSESEPALEEVGGIWQEPFDLPLDPDLLLQRTGNACLNEAGFPPNSFDSENAWVFFDFACEAGSAGPLGCHRNQLAEMSCVEALENSIGGFETSVVFERLEWDQSMADEVRVGEVTHVDAPDLKVVEQDLGNSRVAIRYFPAESCALLEQCVDDSGWRRLLQFDATVHNVGGKPLHIGPVVAADPAYNLFQYNACHDHFHFSDYGDFFFSDAEQNVSSKQAFCVESTGRKQAGSTNTWLVSIASG